jgi:uncharacterized protein (TIGR03437 family)
VARSEPVSVNILPYAPGIFYDPGTRLGAILVANSGVKTDVRAAVAGVDFVEIYGTGLGPVPMPANAVQVFIAGRRAEVVYSGYAGGYEGLYQLNARVPQDVPAGSQPVRLEVGGRSSNEVLIHIR